jgi:twinkle protein
MEAVEYCILHSTDCPIDGEVTLADVEDGVDDIRENGLPDGVTLGLYDFDEYLKFLPGQFIILTGCPGTGKSTFADFIALRLLTLYGWKCAMFSPEKRPVKNHYAELEAKILGYNIHDKVRVSEANHERCKTYIKNNIFHIGGDIRNDMDTILHTALQMKLKHGIRFLLIDPFAYIDLSHESGVTDYEKINENIKMLADFTSKNDLCTVLVAHPRKPTLLASGRYAMPTLYDISGSSMFYNLCDTGIILHKDETINRVVVYVEKVRDQPRMGSIGHCAICFDPDSGRFNISQEKKLPNGATQYVDFNINHKIWLPNEDGVQTEMEFDAPEPGCPF